MFEGCDGSAHEALSAVLALLARPSDCVTDPERIDRIRLLEDVRSATAAAQARETADFAASQRCEQRTAGMPAERVGRGVAAQVALARRISPYSAQRYVGWSTILTTELPATLAALTSGRTTEWRAMLVARETAWLSRDHRALVDQDIAARIESLGDKRVEDETKRAAYRLDPQGYLDRIRGAEKDRRVSVRPAPDVMARLSALLPAAQGVACYAALTREADTLIGVGDARGRGQIMADTLVARITGQAAASDVPIEVNLVMTDTDLFDPGSTADTADTDGAARLDGYGTVPAAWARDLVLGAADVAPVWLRRLFLAPTSGELAGLESRRRTFTGNQRRFIRLRDERCRTPWCEAPIRHFDHIRPAGHGGPTYVTNGQGLCVACNHAKQAPGWRHQTSDANIVTTTTPTGHRYRSRAPALPGVRRSVSPVELSPIEKQLAQALSAA